MTHFNQLAHHITIIGKNLVLLLFLTLISVTGLTASAQTTRTIEFSDDFNDGNYDGWSSRQNAQSDNPAQPCKNGVAPAAWEVIEGKLRIVINDVPCVMVLAIDNLNVSPFNSYVYRFSMFYEGEALANRNFVWAWHNSQNWMGVMTYGDTIHLQKMIGGAGTSFTDLSVHTVPYDFTDNTLYNYEVIVVAHKYITLKINGEIIAQTVDNGLPLPSPLTVGFQAGVGADSDTAIQFDDVVVESQTVSILSATAKHLNITGEGGTTDLVPLPDMKTFDGNIVHFSVTLSNTLDISQAWTLRLRNIDTDEELGEEVHFMLSPNQTQVIPDLKWDTINTAWKSNPPGLPSFAGTYHLSLEIVSSFGYVWESTAIDITVRPRPVILVHGWRDSQASWASYKDFMREKNPLWLGLAAHSLSTGQPSGTFYRAIWNGERLKNDIDSWQDELDFQHFDLVGHSMGGLISRSYLHDYGSQRPPGTRPSALNLITLGTPHTGGPCAEIGVQVAWEGAFHFVPDYMITEFNPIVKDLNETKLIALGGAGIPSCGKLGDGAVPLQSALAYGVNNDYAPFTAHNPQVMWLWWPLATDYLTSETQFNNFVFPRLATPWSAPTRDTTLPLPPNREEFDAPPVTQTFNITVLAGQTITQPVTAYGGSDLGVMFGSAPGIAAELRDSSNTLITNLTTEEMNSLLFPMLPYETAPAGTYTVDLTNTGTLPVTVRMVVFEGGLPQHLAVNSIQDGDNVILTATVTDSSVRVVGTSVTASVSLADTDTILQTLTLLDDGLNGDGAANDGVYGGRAAIPYSGVYVVNFTAQVGDMSLTEVTVIEAQAGNLLTNPSFEISATKPRLAQGWLGKGLGTSDKRVCTTVTKPIPTIEGACVFQFSGGNSTRPARSIKQTFMTPNWGDVGDTLTLSAHIEANKFKNGAKMILSVTYTDSTTAKVIAPIASGTYGYTELTRSLLITKPIQKVVVTLNIAKVAGRVRVDDVSLTLTATIEPAIRNGTASTIPLPIIPDNFRGIR